MTEPIESIARDLAKIRLFSVDLDGTLTDGSVYYTDAGDAMRKFNVRDGMGLKMMMEAGLPVALVTASRTEAIAKRAAVLKIPHFHMGVEHKLPVMEDICRRIGCTLAEVAHIGDDVNDLPLLRAVGLPLAVGDALPPVLAVARYVTRKPGGAGAVREVCDWWLTLRAAAGS